MGSSGFNNQNNAHYLGITEPISLGGPTDYDVIKTRELEKVSTIFQFNCCLSYVYLVQNYATLRIVWAVFSF